VKKKTRKAADSRVSERFGRYKNGMGASKRRRESDVLEKDGGSLLVGRDVVFVYRGVVMPTYGFADVFIGGIGRGGR
jgi:hypothetical protein